MKLILLAVTSTTPAVTVITAIIIIIISIITFRKINQGNAAVETQRGRTWGYPLFLSLNGIALRQPALW